VKGTITRSLPQDDTSQVGTPRLSPKNQKNKLGKPKRRPDDVRKMNTSLNRNHLSKKKTLDGRAKKAHHEKKVSSENQIHRGLWGGRVPKNNSDRFGKPKMETWPVYKHEKLEGTNQQQKGKSKSEICQKVQQKSHCCTIDKDFYRTRRAKKNNRTKKRKSRANIVTDCREKT